MLQTFFVLPIQEFEKFARKFNMIPLLGGIPRDAALTTRKCQTRTLHDENGWSSDSEEIASAKSFCRGLPDFGSSSSSVFSSGNRAYHFDMVEGASAAV
jgi:hypothetical protein